MQIEIDQLHAHETFIVLEEQQHAPMDTRGFHITVFMMQNLMADISAGW